MKMGTGPSLIISRNPSIGKTPEKRYVVGGLDVVPRNWCWLIENAVRLSHV